MKRFALGAGMLAATLVLAWSSSAQAQDHPDLIDGTWVGKDNLASTAQVQGSTSIIMTAQGASLAHSLGGYADLIGSSASGSHRLVFFLYEPDSVKRGKKTLLKQKTQLGYSLQFTRTTGMGSVATSISGLAPSCGGSLAGGAESSPGVAPVSYQVTCKSLLADIGLAGPVLAEIQDYFSNVADSRIKFPKKFAGSDPNANF